MSSYNELDESLNQHYQQINKLLEHRTRFAICALLQRHDQIAFSRFKQLLKETDGNLGAQLRKLEGAGYITVSKEFLDRRPISWYAITDSGKNALEQHLKGLQAMLGSDVSE